MPSLSSLSPDFGLLPTPSPELGHSRHIHGNPHSHHRGSYGEHRHVGGHSHNEIFLHGAGSGSSAGLPTWEVLRDDGSSGPVIGGGPGSGMTMGGAGLGAGTKRSHDTIEDFFTDLKKRRVNPSYDPRQ